MLRFNLVTHVVNDLDVKVLFFQCKLVFKQVRAIFDHLIVLLLQSFK